MTHRMTGIGWSAALAPMVTTSPPLPGSTINSPSPWNTPGPFGGRGREPPYPETQVCGRTGPHCTSPSASVAPLPPLGIHPGPNRVDDHFGDRLTKQTCVSVHRAMLSRPRGTTKAVFTRCRSSSLATAYTAACSDGPPVGIPRE